MLLTNLKHIESVSEYEKFIKENSNVMICCGRMAPCVPLYIRLWKYLRKNICMLNLPTWTLTILMPIL